MFHWICPECGREIAPTVRECPVCDPAAATVEAALAGEVEAPARAGKPAAPPATSVGPAAAGPQREPKPFEPIAPRVAVTPVIAPVHPAPIHPTPVQPTPVQPATIQPATIPAAPVPAPSTITRPAQAAPPALAGHLEPVSPLAARSSQSIAKQDIKEDALLPQLAPPSMRRPSAPEPPPAWEALPLPMVTASDIPASLRAFIAELGPASAEPRIPLTLGQQRHRVPEPPPLTNPIPLPLRSSPQASAAPLGSNLLALPVDPPPAVQPSVRPWEPEPPLAPLGNYSPLEGRPLRPAAPWVQLLKKECAPRTTLPGPMLMRRLVKFMDRELTSLPPEFLRVKKRLIPGWMATALILGTLLGAGFTSVISIVRPTAEAKPSAAAQTDSGAAAAVSTPPVAGVSASPLAKAIEVTGFRIQTDPAKKSEIQYLVVNHSSARFSGVTVYVTLYAADAKAGQPPLCRFQFTAPNLAPYQAKEMASAIERIARPVSLPDWQDLRATVEIGE